MIKFIFFGMIWASMIAYFYIVNLTRISHNMLTAAIKGLYFIFYKATYYDKKENIKKGLEPIFETLNIKINTFGYLNNSKPTLYVCNHQSYLDSLILKYIKPDIKTIAKSDTAGEFSIIKNFANTILDNWGVILYKRGDKKSGSEVRNLIKENILKDQSILVYPEGTSYAFEGLKKFYPGSFEVAYQNNFIVQPITIKYLTDITWGSEHEYSKDYHNDMLANSEQCQKIDCNTVNVTFHPPLYSNNFENAEHLREYSKYLITEEWITQHNYSTNQSNNDNSTNNHNIDQQILNL